MRYKRDDNEVELTYGNLNEGETLSGEVCPACKGGRQQEKSFSVSRSRGVLLYTCHRAGCGFKGSSGASTASIGAGSGAAPAGGRVRITPAPLSEEAAKLLAEKFGLTREAMEFAGIKCVQGTSGNYTGRVYFPCYRPDLRERGASFRSYTGGYPKSLLTLDTDEVGLAWYKFKRSSPALVVVEDQVSAIKVAPYHHSVALLGTNLSDAKLAEIKKQGYKRVYLCLDNDATGLAIRYAVSLRSRLPNLQVVELGKDIKNMNEEEFTAFLNELNS